MFKINKTPILILSTPRTGSTVLGAYIKSLFGKDIPYFIEPDYFGQVGISKFQNYFNISKEFILKCHFIRLDRYGTDISDYLLHEAYKIRIRRKDFVKQAASLYIAMERKQYHFRNIEQLNFVDNISINTKKITHGVISYLKYANYKLDSAPVNFDLDLYYEDLPNINDADFYIVPKPSNYNELLDTIKKLVE
jgi:hypothetical protein